MFHDLVKNRRKELGISLRAFARETEINRGTIREFERDGQGLRVEQLETMLDYLGYKLEAVHVRDLPVRLKHVRGKQKPKALIKIPLWRA